MLGLAVTAWSFLRSSRLAMYAALAVAALVLVILWRRALINEGVARAVAKAAVAATERMERNREIHREIRQLPLPDRARRLRELDGAR